MKTKLLLFMFALCALLGMSALTETTSVTSAAGNATTPLVIQPTKFDRSTLPLRKMIGKPVLSGSNLGNANRATDAYKSNAYADQPDGAIDTGRGENDNEAMPAPGAGWNGINSSTSGCGCLPPDTNGDVGPNHYVQAVNTRVQIWSKTGTSLWGPSNGNSFFAGFGGPCETTNDGDPIVVYDKLADRWMYSQFALPNYPSGPFYQCIAVSTSSNPTGSYYRYQYTWPNNYLNDYPKFGVWSDGYYLTVNQFNGNSWAGTGAAAFDRAKMLTGAAATMIYFNLGSSDPGGMLPSNFTGSTAPPAGEPNYFVEFNDSRTDSLKVRAFRANWTTPSSSTFNQIASLTVASFNSNMCNYSRSCIAQKGTRRKLDAISDRMMYRLNYRNFGTYASIVGNHTVNAGSNRGGVRWYEIRVTGGTPSIYQQSSYAPSDGLSRWMGAIAQDKQGNIAVGFSASNSTNYPSIRYAGRLATDTLNSLAQGEATMKAGNGSQTSTSSRWGDYSSMSVDPVDDCTFWYTQEYYNSTSSAGWATWIGNFKFPGCQ